jgi:hypothetical protein
MRRAREIRLVLLGGGLALALSACGESEACREARAENRPDASLVCRSSGGGGSWHSWFTGYHGSGGGAQAASARGGFGGTGGGFSGGG